MSRVSRSRKLRAASGLILALRASVPALGAAQTDWAALLAPVAAVQPAAIDVPAPQPTPVVQPPPAPPAQVTVTSDEILAALRDELLATHDLAGDLLLFPSRALPVLTFPGETVELAFHGLNLHQLRATFSGAVEVIVDGLPVRRVPLNVRLEHWVDAWQTQGSLARQAAVSPSQLTVTAVDTLRERGELIYADQDLRGYETARPLSPGTVLTWRHLARRPAVRQGAQVDVTAREGLLAITLRAQALEDGAIGDFIRVRNLQSRREFRAQIISDNALEVQF